MVLRAVAAGRGPARRAAGPVRPQRGLRPVARQRQRAAGRAAPRWPRPRRGAGCAAWPTRCRRCSASTTTPAPRPRRRGRPATRCARRSTRASRGRAAGAARARHRAPGLARVPGQALGHARAALGRPAGLRLADPPLHRPAGALRLARPTRPTRAARRARLRLRRRALHPRRRARHLRGAAGELRPGRATRGCSAWRASVHYLDVGGIPVPEAAGPGERAGRPARAACRRRRAGWRPPRAVFDALYAAPDADRRPGLNASTCAGPRRRRRARRPSSFGEALRFWLKLGFISFGGPAGQIAIMHTELVERRRWISEQRFLHALNYCMLLPGPEAQQLATYIGWLMHRTWGGIVAGALFVLPSLFILIALSLDLHALRRRAAGGRPVLRHQAGRDGDRAARGAPHRHAGAEERLDVGHRGGCLRRHLRLRRAVPGHRARPRR